MIATANAEMIMIAQKDPELARILNGADLVFLTAPAYSGPEKSWAPPSRNG